MRTALLLFTSILFQTSFGQLKFGTYQIVADKSPEVYGRLFSELLIKPNNVFTYKFRTTSCFLWYDTDGKWKLSNDTLTLSDRITSFHSIIEFTQYQQTTSKKIIVTVKGKDNKPISGIKILYSFRNSNDTLDGMTDSEGRFIIDTKYKTPTVEEGKYLSNDDAEIWLVYFTKKQQDQTTNYLTALSSEIECIINDDAKNEDVLRTTIYKVDNNNLVYISQYYDKTNVSPGRYLVGDYKFDKE